LPFNGTKAAIGTYDFLFYGFPYIAEQFTNSVVPICIVDNDGNHDIGTGFLLGNIHTLVTARHVVENASLIQIYGKDGQIAEGIEVTYPTDKRIDVALITISNFVFEGQNPFRAEDALVLEDVMTIGYPPISGFDALQLFEVSSINNSFKFSKGKIVGKGTSYLDQIEYLIINAKVKGGNSGSPVINTKGNLVGMVVQIPIDSQDSTKLDALGYGIVIPTIEIKNLLNAPNHYPKVEHFKIDNLENGFKILNEESTYLSFLKPKKRD